MKIASNAFQHNQEIPEKYTCQGDEVNPPLRFLDVPDDTKSLALIVDDPDAPSETWVHWVLWNLSPNSSIGEDDVPEEAVQGKNSWDRNEYGGPCPPSGTHRYFFKLYALDAVLNLSPQAGKEELEHAMDGHILDQAELIGLYSK